MESEPSNNPLKNFYNHIKLVVSSEYGIKIKEKNGMIQKFSFDSHTFKLKKSLEVDWKLSYLLLVFVNLINADRNLDLHLDDKNYVGDYIYEKYLHTSRMQKTDPKNKEKADLAIQRFDFLYSKYK